MTPGAESLGVAFVPTQPPETLPALAAAADEWLDELWVWEDCFAQSGIASAAVALARTDQVRVGLGLMPAPLRNVALAAMEVATLSRLHPGRFLPGVGHGVQDWMGQVGERVDSPMTLLREYTAALRRLLDGELVDTEGRYVHVRGVQLTWPPAALAPLYLGGVGPRTVDLAARLGDGVLLANTTTPTQVARIRERMRVLRPDGGEIPLVATVLTAVGPGAQDRARRELPHWTSETDLTMTAAGDPAAVAASYRAFLAAGATSVVAQPTRDEPDIAELVRTLGQDVRSLLRSD